MKNQLAFLFCLLAGITTTAQKRAFDTSTPEKYLQALASVPESPATQNPLPFFYDKVSAETLTQFDKAGEKGLGAFQAFRESLAAKFASKIKFSSNTVVRLYSDDNATASFQLSGNLIGKQLRERKATDYEFVSATSPDASGVVQLACKIKGNEATIPIKKENGHFVMFMDDENIQKLKKMTEFFEMADKFYSECVREMQAGIVTENNFTEKVLEWEQGYMKLVAFLNSK
jgi:hypothetical protein